MQSQHKRDRKRAVYEPFRHIDPEQAGHDAV